MERCIKVDDILESAKNALKILLDNAEKRGYEYPVPCEAVAELEFVISELWWCSHSFLSRNVAETIYEEFRIQEKCIAQLEKELSKERERAEALYDVMRKLYVKAFTPLMSNAESREIIRDALTKYQGE